MVKKPAAPVGVHVHLHTREPPARGARPPVGELVVDTTQADDECDRHERHDLIPPRGVVWPVREPGSRRARLFIVPHALFGDLLPPYARFVAHCTPSESEYNADAVAGYMLVLQKFEVLTDRHLHRVTVYL